MLGKINLFRKLGIVASISAVILVGFSVSTARADVIGERHTFFVDSTYDASSRTSVSATLAAVGNHAYIYIEDQFLNQYGGAQSPAIVGHISQVVNAFDNEIYPVLIDFWGSEPNPGIDNDPHVVILFEKMTPNTGGYFDSSNLFPSRTNSPSNQREMISISTDALLNDQAKVFITHEMEHLISVNQKWVLFGAAEEVWLDELRAQYSITIAGYNTPFDSSDLYNRLRNFLKNPTDSLTQWQGTALDYAPVSLFGEYLVEQYGPAIVSDTLKSSLSGIDSINAWLTQNKYQERFRNIFGNWLVANYINKTSPDSRFGYKNSNLATINVSPTDVRTLNYTDSKFDFYIESWQPQWYKFILPGNIPLEQNLRISWNTPQISMMYSDDQGNAMQITNGGSIVRTPGMTSFTVMPVSPDKLPSVELNIGFTTDLPVPAIIPDGALIRRQGESEIYVVEGKYKRYLSAGVIALYGHLDRSKTIELKPERFDVYVSANYVRSINEQKVYAVWPDGTKHWLHMSAKTFSETGRDWNSIFIINDNELNFYKTGPEITR